VRHLYTMASKGIKSSENSENLRLAFQESSNNMRYFLDDRFKIFTLTTVVSGAAFSLLGQYQIQLLDLVLSIMALLVTFICWIMDRSSRHYYEKYHETASKIQESLNVDVYKKESRPWYKRSTPWVNVFYLVLIGVWFVILFTQIPK